MIRTAAAIAASIAAAAMLVAPSARRTSIEFPAGIVEVRSEMIVESGTEVRGASSGTVLRMAPEFSGRAAIVARGSGVRLHDFTIEGNREVLDIRAELPPYDVPFARFARNNGVLAEDIEGLSIERVEFRGVSGFAILASRARRVTIDRVRIFDSGSRNAAGRNNTTGGILLEEGVSGFRVTNCLLQNIRGNGVWTHSLYTSPRNGPGLIARNRIDTVGRDAIQVGHAFDVRVEENSGERIGFPYDDVDLEGRAVPVAIDTAGNVERSRYNRNRFEEINGKCIDLDGFHHGEVRGNICANRGAAERYRFGGYGIVMNNSNPDMQSEGIRVVDNLIDGPLFGGIFVIGSGHTIARNRLINLNMARCVDCYLTAGEPDLLRSGIYLGKGAERPAAAHGNAIENNEIAGFEMKARCIGTSPGIQLSANTIRDNVCK